MIGMRTVRIGSRSDTASATSQSPLRQDHRLVADGGDLSGENGRCGTGERQRREQKHTDHDDDLGGEYIEAANLEPDYRRSLLDQRAWFRKRTSRLSAISLEWPLFSCNPLLHRFDKAGSLNTLMSGHIH